ncbi:MAG: ATP-binding protein [Bryobacteraceae bacterium]
MNRVSPPVATETEASRGQPSWWKRTWAVSRGRLRLPQSIAAQTTVLSWMIAISTLTIFVAVSLPQQKSDLLDGLDAKARTVVASLHEVLAAAAVTEDYSTVVDECVRHVSGDEAIEYLVVTKNDGFSLTIDRKGWRGVHLDSWWRPEKRAARAAIETTPLGGRVFHLAAPFNYSTIPWGWIHVGLSLKAFDSSVSTIYQRTTVIAIICVGLSLLASGIYATRLVQPILRLETVVRQVADGDLSARASTASAEEIQALGESINTMTDSLLERDRMLESVRFAAQRFLSMEGWQTVISEVLAKIGAAADVGRVFLLEAHPFGLEGFSAELLGEWTAPPLAIGNGRPRSIRLEQVDPLSIIRIKQLKAGEAVCISNGDLPSICTRAAGLTPKSAILVPVEVGGQWFGELGLEDYRHERDWREAERDSFRSIARMLGASITRQQAQDYVDNILSSMGEALLVIDSEMRITRVNPSALKLLRYSSRELVGQPVSRVIVDGPVPPHSSAVERKYRTKWGEEIPVLFSSAELGKSPGVPEGYVCLAQELTQLKWAQAELERARDAAEAANRAKSVFLANMSHELRTPLNAIIGYSQMLQEDYIGPEQVEVRGDLEKIERSGHNLLGIINDVLDISKIEAGREQVTMQNVDLSVVVRDVLHTVEPLARQQGNQVTVDCPPSARPAFADPAKLRQSILNLVNNACKFTQNGTVSVAIRRFPEDVAEWSEICVTDTGIGISPEHLDKLFQPFSQVDDSSTRKYNGTGLGLVISKKFCQMMGGDITVESKPGSGSRFTIRIPARHEITEARPLN